jgi:hypothetical protein
MGLWSTLPAFSAKPLFMAIADTTKKGKSDGIRT